MSADARIECGGVLERSGLCLVEFLGLQGASGRACSILDRFGDAGVSLAYVAIVNGTDRSRHVSFCIDRMDLPASEPLLAAVRAELEPAEFALREPVTKLTLYGPHFQEKHALVAGVFSALCARGVRAHGISMSVNSISIVVDGDRRDTAVDCLQRRFVWPE